MGYRIEYDSRISRYEVVSEKKVFPKICFFAAIILAASLFLWPQGAQALSGLLIPGDDAVTIQAFHALSGDLRSGAPLDEALESFCRFVLDEK